MKTVRFFILFLSLLVGSLVDSSSLSSLQRVITCRVGNQVVLPCSWKSRLQDVAPSSCHIQWTKPVETVFEQWGERQWQADEFAGRATLPEERLDSGDCSLIISDVQIGDAGTYESFMVVDGVRSRKTRVFIQGVKLSVFDHKSRLSLGLGEDLVLDLHTQYSVRVVFLGRNSSQWSDLWMRGNEDSERLEKHPLKEQLTIKKLKSSDEGTFKVLDANGLAVSTVQLFVEERTDAQRQVWDDGVLAGDPARSCSSALPILSVFVASFQILHLL
uniref:galectin 17 n=1 Tax=Scatophagus argus TaxID=75038 RepID=UPI001ED7D731|nr:galectin 17 [Scatophagus argus]